MGVVPALVLGGASFDIHVNDTLSFMFQNFRLYRPLDH